MAPDEPGPSPASRIDRDQMRQLAIRLKGLRALQDEIVGVVRHCQDIITFGDHPDLTTLDDEMDNLYGGQL
jgi:hypothetical protein